MATKTGAKKKRDRRVVKYAVAHIQASFNNTIVTISDLEGAVLCWSSSGGCNYKGSKKSTPYAATVVSKTAVEKAMEFGVEILDVRVKGPGSGRESAVRGLAANGVRIRSIRDVTPVPHNGCRAPKRRRV